jgi:hypothetical protein
VAEPAPSNRDGRALLRLAGVQSILVGGFFALAGYGFFPLPGLVFGGAALVVLGVVAFVMGRRR